MFEHLKALPPDPILGLMAAYNQDSNPKKIDLGVGVYKNEAGETPVLEAVKKAEAIRLDTENSKSYIAPPGVAGANTGMQELLLGKNHSALAADRVRMVQTPGGCGALRLAAEFIAATNPKAKVWVSNPTWANHIPLLGAAGLQLEEYPYYDYTTHGVDFDSMMATLTKVPAGDLVLLHGCCHNPCGAELTAEQWDAVTELALKNGFTPFIDIAYQGFGQGLEPDAYGVRLMAEKLPELLVASSCSKNFGLYRERAGALMVVYGNSEQATIGLTQVNTIARGIYSMPPAHGSAIVDIILHDAELRKLWEQELAGMRDRINGLRSLLVNRLKEKGADGDFSFIERERGMFSFLGISQQQVQRLKDEYSIYMVGSSRINVAGISDSNIDYLTDSIVAVL